MDKRGRADGHGVAMSQANLSVPGARKSSSQRAGNTSNRRDENSSGQRDENSSGQRDENSSGQREQSTSSRHERNPPSQREDISPRQRNGAPLFPLHRYTGGGQGRGFANTAPDSEHPPVTSTSNGNFASLFESNPLSHRPDPPLFPLPRYTGGGQGRGFAKTAPVSHHPPLTSQTTL
jgi:hypothetical protein